VVGVILGSGLGDFAEQMTHAVSIPYADIPGFPRSGVAGHAGKLVAGKVRGVPAAVLAGRVHYYEGHPMPLVVFPARVLARIGCRAVIVTNAAGGIARRFKPGDLMLIEDHLNFFGTNPLIGPNDEELGPRFPDMSDTYRGELRKLALRVARREHLSLKRGVYVGVHGPSYETPAEIRAFRTLGADAVGMSTVPEAIALGHMGVGVLGISCITNMAAGVLAQKLDHAEVLATTERARGRFTKLLNALIHELGKKALTLALAALLGAGAMAGARPAAAAQAAPAKAPATSSQATPVDLLVTAREVLTLDAEGHTFAPGAVAIRAGKIVAVGEADRLRAEYRPAHTLLRPKSIVMPGLINTHTHAAMCLMRGIADDEPLMVWLQKSIFPAEAKNVSPAFVRAGTRLACAEMIRGGTTTFADMYYFESDVASVVDSCGMRGVLGETWLDFPTPDHKDLAATEAMTRAFLERWKGHSRITAAIAPHAPYTCSAATLVAARKLADEYGAPLLIHVAETRDEAKQIGDKYGMSPVRWLDSIGFLSSHVLAAHGVWVDSTDMRILAMRHVALSHNPESNMKLGSGVAPVAAERAAGITVALGTDGPAGSNDDLDMWEAMDFAGKLAKVSALDPTVLPARELLRMATIEGAKALGLGAVTGSLEVGKAADLIAVDLDAPRTSPVYDVASALVYSAKESDVSLTMVEGRVLWDGARWTTLDAAAAMRDAEQWRAKISASLAP